MKRSVQFAGVALALSMAVNSQAAVVIGDIIGIDFGATADTDELTWNQFTVGGSESTNGIAAGATVSLSAIKNTLGSSLSGVTFSLQNNAGQIAYDFGRGGAAGGEGVNGDGALIADDDVYADSLMANDRSGTGRPQPDGANFVLTFAGLNDGLTYNLSGGNDLGNDNFNVNWAADGQSATTSNSGNGYVSLTGLSTDGSGNLVITLTETGNADHVTVAALTLEAVPEPSAALLGCLGAFGLLVRRRR